MAAKPLEKSLSGYVVPYMRFEEYSEQFKDLFKMKRENGIIEVRMHTNDGPTQWNDGLHKGWGQVFECIGQDPENEVLILGSTGDHFIGGVHPDFIEWNRKMSEKPGLNEEQVVFGYETEWLDGRALLNNLLNLIHIPTIGVVNGPSSGLTCLATLCDITICADHTVFNELHFSGNMCPGDGHFMSYQMLAGYKRANYMAYTGQGVDAKTAQEWGIVNEVVPLDKLYPRAWELAEMMMTKNRYVRRLTHEMMVKPWKEYAAKEFNNHFAMEMISQNLVRASSNFSYKDSMEESFNGATEKLVEEAREKRGEV